MSRCAVLISGHGSNLQALIDAAVGGDLNGDVAVVVSDQADAYGLHRAERAGIPTRLLSKHDYHGRRDFDRGLANSLGEFQPDLLVLAGFMRILGPEFVARYGGRILNVHPSLLPRHPGLNTYRRVLQAGDDVHGATVHFVTDELDAGPAVIQYRIPVTAADTEETLSARVQAGEHIILPRAVGWFLAGRLRMDGQRVYLDDERLVSPKIMDEG